MRILILIFYLFSYLVLSHEYEKNNIVVDHPILKINSDRSKVGAGYMKIINNSTGSYINNKKKSYSYSSIYSTDTDDANPDINGDYLDVFQTSKSL